MLSQTGVLRVNATTVPFVPQERLNVTTIGTVVSTPTGRLDGLCARAAGCRACPGMGCAPVLSPANGPAGARVVFVGEASGRLGAGKTGVPFSGDVAGDRFERLLGEAGLRREAVFVTNAVLCLPLDGRGLNRTPRRRESRSCSGWLRETIDAVQPRVVVAMGRIALEALAEIEPHGLTLALAGGDPVRWRGGHLAVVYHPGARAQVHRPWAAQVQDWCALGTWLMERARLERKLRA